MIKTMHKTTKVIALGALIAAFAFMGCGAPDEGGENSAVAGRAAAGSSSIAGTTSVAGTRSTTGGATGTGGSSVVTSHGGSSTTGVPSTTDSAMSSGCSVGHGASSEGALGGIALALALAFVARRRRPG